MTQHKNTHHLPPIDKLMTGLANAKRREIVRILLKGEVSVGTLSYLVSLSQSALSQHLKKLRDFQLVTTRREGQTIYYYCDHPDAAWLMSVIDDIAQGAPLNQSGGVGPGVGRALETIVSTYASETSPNSPAPPDHVELLTPDQAWQELCETPDITSPEEYPDHALITMEQLADYMRRAAASEGE